MIDIPHVDHAAVDERQPVDRFPISRHRVRSVDLCERGRPHVVMRGKVDERAVEPCDESEEPVAQPCSTFGNRVEDRPDTHLDTGS